MRSSPTSVRRLSALRLRTCSGRSGGLGGTIFWTMQTGFWSRRSKYVHRLEMIFFILHRKRQNLLYIQKVINQILVKEASVQRKVMVFSYIATIKMRPKNLGETLKELEKIFLL